LDADLTSSRTVHVVRLLAEVLYSTGGYIAADGAMKKTVETSFKDLGLEHPQTLHIQARLSECYKERGQELQASVSE